MDVKLGNSRTLTVKSLTWGDTVFVPMEEIPQRMTIGKIINKVAVACGYPPNSSFGEFLFKELDKNNYVIMRIEERKQQEFK